MEYVKVDGGGISGAEMIFLAALLVVCAVVAWRLYARSSGRDVSDVQGLRFTKRHPGPPA